MGHSLVCFLHFSVSPRREEKEVGGFDAGSSLCKQNPQFLGLFSNSCVLLMLSRYLAVAGGTEMKMFREQW